MGIHEKTKHLINEIYKTLEPNYPMTVRQVYYQLVSRQVLENNKSEYQRLSNALVYARQEGIIPWDWIEDRIRRPKVISYWDNLQDFLETVRNSYRKSPWEGQNYYVEVWLEKDALSGIFEEILSYYRIILNVGRGYDGWSSIYLASQRLGSGENCVILYFGDFDPSGEDMVRSLEERLAFFNCRPLILKSALTFDDILKYNLPPDFTKTRDKRRKKFVEKWGDIAVELDALPVDVLRERIKNEVERFFDLEKFNEILKMEENEIVKLNNLTF